MSGHNFCLIVCVSGLALSLFVKILDPAVRLYLLAIKALETVEVGRRKQKIRFLPVAEIAGISSLRLKNRYSSKADTIWPGSSDPFYIVTY